MTLLVVSLVWFGLSLGVLALARAAAAGDAMSDGDSDVGFDVTIPRRHDFMAIVDAEVLRAARYARPLSVAVLEVSGTEAQMLGEVGRRLDEAVRHSDVIGRIGDRQLAVLMPETPQSDALHAAVRLLGEIRDEPIAGDRPEVWVGVADVHPGDTGGTLLRRADDALFHVKRAGDGAVGAPALPAAPAAV